MARIFSCVCFALVSTTAGDQSDGQQRGAAILDLARLEQRVQQANVAMSFQGHQRAMPSQLRARRTPPQVASTWTAFFTGRGKSFYFPKGVTFRLAFDLSNERFSVIDMESKMGPISGSILDLRFRNNPVSSSWWTKLGYCAPLAMDWASALYIHGFGWLRDAAWIQSNTVNGLACDVWALSQPSKYEWSACMTSDGLPVEYQLLVSGDEIGSTLAPIFSLANLTGLNVSRTVNPEHVEQSSECQSWPPQPCPDTGVAKLPAYRMCGTCFDTPVDSDAGDLAGELVPMCTGSYGEGGGPDHVIRYDMSVNQSYGPYQLFNYIKNQQKSVGSLGVSNLVGRSVLYGICTAFPTLPQCGQCTSNPEGSWLSFPQSGQCAPGASVGTDGCTWQVESYTMKEFKCILPRIRLPCLAYFSAMEGKSPKLAELAMKAVAKNVEAALQPLGAGGCPEIPVVASATSREQIVV